MANNFISVFKACTFVVAMHSMHLLSNSLSFVAAGQILQEYMVSLHDQYRAQHCAGPLTWDDQIASYAQSYAQTLCNAGAGLVHSGVSGYGENLAWIYTGGSYDEASVTTQTMQLWYQEVSYCEAAASWQGCTTAPFEEVGHFTQLIWQASTSFGCGACVGVDSGVYVSCNYSPPGNVIGSFPENVKPAGGQC